ncbi:L-lactate dehydrogenase [Trueperella sp. LYQ143]|uniref:L-lactate dehydrogenase n=1 Tax=unclassified Trueperella TaxID=2630174 RepID=UPI003983645A
MSDTISRPTKISILGAGAVGATLAYACLTRGSARDIALYDINRAKVEAEALDIAQGQTFAHVSNVLGSDDPEVCRGSDIVIVTAGAKQKPGQSRLELAGATIGIMEKMLPSILEVAPNAIYLMVSNPVDVVTYASMKITGLPRERMFGSGTVLDTSRYRLLIAQELGVAPRSIHGYIVGEHGDSEIALWSSTNIGCVPVKEWGGITQQRCEEIAHDVMASAYRIIEGKGATNYAIGLSGARIVEAILRDERTILPVSSYIDGIAGINDVCLSMPTVVGRSGVGRLVVPAMTQNELDGLHASAQSVRQVAAQFGY